MSGGVTVGFTGFENLTADAGAGNDTLFLINPTAPGSVQLLGGGDDDRFTLTYPVASASLTADGGAGNNSLAVGLTDANETVMLDAASVQVTGATTTAYNNMAQVTLDTRGGGDVVSVAGTVTSGVRIDTGLGADTVTVQATQGELSLNTGADADTLNIRAAGFDVAVDLGDCDDTVNVGSLTPATGGTVNGVVGLLQVNGDGGTDVLNVDNTGDTAANRGTLSGISLTRLGMAAGITYGTLEALNVNLGSGGNTHLHRGRHCARNGHDAQQRHW